MSWSIWAPVPALMLLLLFLLDFAAAVAAPLDGCRAAAADVVATETEAEPEAMGLKLIQKASAWHSSRASTPLRPGPPLQQQQQQQQQQQSSPSPALPQLAVTEAKTRTISVYVYDIPDSVPRGDIAVNLRDDCRQPKVHGCVETATVGSEEWLTALFGTSEQVTIDGGRTVACRQMTAYANARILYTTLQLHPERTTDPEKADLFLIPIYTEDWLPDVATCPTFEEVVELLPHLNEENAGRHIWMAPTPGWFGEACPPFYAHSNDPSAAARLLSKTTKLSLEDTESAPESVFWNETAGEAAMLGITWAPPISENLHSVPYATVVSGLDDKDLEAWKKVAFDTKRVRSKLVSAFLNTTHGMMQALITRNQLQAICESRPDACHHKATTNESLSASDFQSFIGELLEAEFCLQPLGDTVSRKGIVDSLVTGCIPVLFNQYQAKLWPWHVGNWQDVAILFDGVPMDLIDLLEQIPQQRRKQLRSNMEQIFPRLVSHKPNDMRPGDFVDTILQHVYDLNRH